MIEFRYFIIAGKSGTFFKHTEKTFSSYPSSKKQEYSFSILKSPGFSVGLKNVPAFSSYSEVL